MNFSILNRLDSMEFYLQLTFTCCALLSAGMTPVYCKNVNSIQERIDQLSERDPRPSSLQGRIEESVVNRSQESAQNSE